MLGAVTSKASSLPRLDGHGTSKGRLFGHLFGELLVDAIQRFAYIIRNLRLKLLDDFVVLVWVGHRRSVLDESVI